MVDLAPGSKGVLFNIQKYSLFDGPGIRTTLFFKGCPLRCEWCSNPESQCMEPELAFEARICIACGRCDKTCPAEAVARGCIDRARCVKCFACVESCPTGALKRYGEEHSVEELVERCARDAVFYRRSGGGVTLSGGEPLLQECFAVALLEACRAEGLRTAVETCGAVRWEALRDVSPWVDTLYFDLKHVDDDKHLAKTGARAEAILSNLKELVQIRDNVVVRVPLIPGFNASDADTRAIASWLCENAPRVPVELLPYHRYGEKKYEMLGRGYGMEGVGVLAENVIADAVAAFVKRGLHCVRIH